MDRSFWEQNFESQKQILFESWQKLISFKTISVQAEHNSDCADCAGWLQQQLQEAGFESELIETPAKPLVFACHDAGPEKPSVLLYGHYDVQPVDPLEEWESDPFQPAGPGGSVSVAAVSGAV